MWLAAVSEILFGVSRSVLASATAWLKHEALVDYFAPVLVDGSILVSLTL